MDPTGDRRQPALRPATTPAPSFATPRRGRWLGVALAVLVLVQLVVAFYPFELDPPRLVDNDVTRTAAGGLQFAVHNKAETAVPPPWLVDARRGATVVVDLLVRPAGDDATGPARILTVSDGFYHGDLTVGQERDDLIVRVRRPGADQAGYPDLVAQGALGDPRWVRVRVVVAPDLVQIDVDGRRVVSQTTASPATARWNTGYRLALGNELGGGRPWPGEIRRADVSVAGTTTDYLVPSALQVPAQFWYDTHRRWEPFLPSTAGDVIADVTHFLLYVPVGALVMLVWPRTRPWQATAAVTVLALAVNSSKVLFAGRHPSLADVVAEACGGLLGALLVQRHGDVTAHGTNSHPKPDIRNEDPAENQVGT